MFKIIIYIRWSHVYRKLEIKYQRSDLSRFRTWEYFVRATFVSVKLIDLVLTEHRCISLVQVPFLNPEQFIGQSLTKQSSENVHTCFIMRILLQRSKTLNCLFFYKVFCICKCVISVVCFVFQIYQVAAFTKWDPGLVVVLFPRQGDVTRSALEASFVVSPVQGL